MKTPSFVPDLRAVLRPLAISAIAATSISYAVPVIGADFTEAGRTYASGRLLLEAQAGLSTDELGRILAVHAARARKIGQSRMHIVDLPPGSEQRVAQFLRNHPAIRRVELDQRVYPALAVNDPYIGSEWHIPKINAPAAWDKTQGAGVVIAILDSGVDATHPDLAPNMVAGYNFVDFNTNTADVCGHGTAVAGTAAARTNNGLGAAGVAGQAKIMPLRISALYTIGCYTFESTMVSAITYAADNGVRIANVSYGGAELEGVRSAAQYMKDKGGLVFFSAGNTATDLMFVPTTTMVTVSATNSTDAKASFSSYGDFVALAAPGEGIITTNNGGGYGSWNGTSFASPVAAGVAALMMAAAPSLSNLEIESALLSSATDLGVAGRDPLYGYGRVDANAAVKAALAKVIVLDTQPPTSVITSPAANSTVKASVTVAIGATDNIGVDRVELSVNGTMVGTDNSAPYAVVWNTTGIANGMASLVATAFDAAGNATASKSVAVNVANPKPPVVKDKVKPVVHIDNPVAGSVSGAVNVSVQASDNSGAPGIAQTLSIDGVVVAKGSGATLAYTWQTSTAKVGNHTLKAVAKDAAGNSANATVKVKVTR